MIPTHYCLKCSKHHSMHYAVAATGKSLVVECPQGQHAIPFQEGLNILTRESKRFQKSKREARQLNFDMADVDVDARSPEKPDNCRKMSEVFEAMKKAAQ